MNELDNQLVMLVAQYADMWSMADLADYLIGEGYSRQQISQAFTAFVMTEPEGAL